MVITPSLPWFPVCIYTINYPVEKKMEKKNTIPSVKEVMFSDPFVGLLAGYLQIYKHISIKYCAIGQGTRDLIWDWGAGHYIIFLLLKNNKLLKTLKRTAM